MNATVERYLAEPETSAHPIADGYTLDLGAAAAGHGWANQVVTNRESSPCPKRGAVAHGDPARAGVEGVKGTDPTVAE